MERPQNQKLESLGADNTAYWDCEKEDCSWTESTVLVAIDLLGQNTPWVRQRINREGWQLRNFYWMFRLPEIRPHSEAYEKKQRRASQNANDACIEVTPKKGYAGTKKEIAFSKVS